MNTITPESTTAALAKDVPLENSKASEEEPKATPVHAIGGFPQTPVDELDKTISVNPLPASDVTKPQPNIAPGEPLPPSAHAGDIHSQVTLDKESYEKSDRLPGLTEANSTLPSTTGADIPESSLPMPAAAIAAGIDTTTINTGEGVHCLGTCTLENVWFQAVCEDAITLKQSAGTSRIVGGGAFDASDKIIQFNGFGTVEVTDFYAENYGKLVRSCGNCKGNGGARNIVIGGVKAVSGGALCGINTNLGDTCSVVDSCQSEGKSCE
ncbi:hypothetical protein BN1708_016335, partial [Verticillium longisporum]